MKSIYSLRFSFLAISLFLNGCSVLVGQVKPVEEKAAKVPFTDVTVIAPNWNRLDMPGKTKSADDIPDAAWQSDTTAAVISLTSACRQTPDEERSDLKEVTRIILSQWDNLSILNENPKIISGLPAWETEAEGKYLGRERKFKTTVVKTSTCVYDLIYLSPVKSFEQELSVFERFRDSLNLK